MKDHLLWMLSRVDEPWYSRLNALANALTFIRHPERAERLGPLNADRTFYVINDFPRHIGLAGWYDRVLGYMIRAERKGWIPVIDSREWGEYFEYPSAYTMEEVRRSSRVVFAHPHGTVYKRVSGRNIALRHRLAQSIRPKPLPCGTFRASDARPSVGVYFRGTDYRRTKEWNAIGHATVPTFGEFFTALDGKLSEWGLKDPRIFAVTEEQAILDEFKRRYPGVEYIEKPRFTSFRFGVSLPEQLPDDRITKKENNLLYLADLQSLAECDYLVGTMNGGVQLALNWNGNAYKGVAILDFGTNRP